MYIHIEVRIHIDVYTNIDRWRCMCISAHHYIFGHLFDDDIRVLARVYLFTWQDMYIHIEVKIHIDVYTNIDRWRYMYIYAHHYVLCHLFDDDIRVLVAAVVHMADIFRSRS